MIESRYWLRNCGRWLSALCSTTSRLTSTVSWLHNTVQHHINSNNSHWLEMCYYVSASKRIVFSRFLKAVRDRSVLRAIKNYSTHQTARLHRGKSGSESRSGRLSKFNGNFLVQRYVSKKIFTKIWSVFCLPEFLDLDPDVEDFQNLTSFFPVHRFISGKIFIKIRSVVSMRGC